MTPGTVSHPHFFVQPRSVPEGCGQPCPRVASDNLVETVRKEPKWGAKIRSLNTCPGAPGRAPQCFLRPLPVGSIQPGWGGGASRTPCLFRVMHIFLQFFCWPAPWVPGMQRLQLAGHVAAVNGVAYSSDNRTVASGGSDKAVEVWDTTSGVPPPTDARAREGWMNTCGLRQVGEHRRRLVTMNSSRMGQGLTRWFGRSDAPLRTGTREFWGTDKMIQFGRTVASSLAVWWDQSDGLYKRVPMSAIHSYLKFCARGGTGRRIFHHFLGV